MQVWRKYKEVNWVQSKKKWTLLSHSRGSKIWNEYFLCLSSVKSDHRPQLSPKSVGENAFVNEPYKIAVFPVEKVEY